MCLFIKVPCKYFIHWCAETKIKLWMRKVTIWNVNALCKFNGCFPPYNVATVFSCLDVLAIFFTNVTNCILLNVCHLKIIFTLNWTSILNIKFKYLSFYLRSTQLYEKHTKFNQGGLADPAAKSLSNILKPWKTS